MKIAVFHELEKGGARRAINEYAKRLKKKHQVDLYVVEKGSPISEVDFFSSVFSYSFNSSHFKNLFLTRFLNDTYDLYRLARLNKRIAHTIDSNGYDLVFVHPSQLVQAPFILRYLKTKKIYYSQEPLRLVYDQAVKIDPQLPLVNKIYENLNRRLRKHLDSINIKKANKILTNSEHTRSNIAKAYGLNSEVCYLGVDVDFFKPLKLKKEIDVLFLGPRLAIEGYELLTKAIKKIPQKVVLHIHTSGITYLGDEDLRALYNKSRIVVALTENEPFGLIPLEAMACGVPVIAINEGGYKETIINGRTGYLIERRDDELAEKITYLLNHKDEAVLMGEKGREFAQSKWNWDIMTKNLEDILNGFIKPHE